MIIINTFDYIKGLSSNAKFKNKGFEDTKKDLEDLHEHYAVFEDLETYSLLNPRISMHIENKDFMQTQLMISEIKEKQEIKDRLNSLSYSVGWLQSAIFIKDEVIINKAINNILKNEYSGINTIVKELNSLKNKIEKFESFHTGMLKNSLSLDVSASLEQDFREKHKKLNELHDKQKTILLNLSNIFVKLTKNSVLKNKK